MRRREEILLGILCSLFFPCIYLCHIYRHYQYLRLHCVECLVNNELESMWKEAVLAWGTMLEYVWKSTKILSQDILYPGRYSNQTFFEYKSQALPLLRRFVPCDQLSNVTDESCLWYQRWRRAPDFFLFCITCFKQRPIVSVLLWQVTR
jgi:hypothetical protein